MEKSRRELYFDTAIHMGTFKNNQIKLFPCFIIIPKRGFSFSLSGIFKCVVNALIMSYGTTIKHF